MECAGGGAAAGGWRPARSGRRRWPWRRRSPTGSAGGRAATTRRRSPPRPPAPRGGGRRRDREPAGGACGGRHRRSDSSASSTSRLRAGDDGGGDLAEGQERQVVAAGPAPQGDGVAVLQVRAAGAVWQAQGTLAGPRQLHQAALGAGVGARHRARREQVAGADGGAVDRGVGQELRERPVLLGERAAGDGERRQAGSPHPDALDCDFEADVVRGPGGRAEVAGGGRVLDRAVQAVGLQCFEGDQPGRHRGGERLAEERAQGPRLGGLHVAGAPVVHQYQAGDVVGERGRGYRRAGTVGMVDDEADLGLEVEGGRRPQLGLPVAVGAGRHPAVGPDDRRPGGHDRPCPPVVGRREPPPVGRQRVGTRPEQAAHVGGVVDRPVEVDEVADGHGQVHLHLVGGDQGGLHSAVTVGDQLGQPPPDEAAGGPTARQERQERRLGEHAARQPGVAEHAGMGQRRQDDHVLADGGHARSGPVGQPGHAQRQVLDPEAVRRRHRVESPRGVRRPTTVAAGNGDRHGRSLLLAASGRRSRPPGKRTEADRLRRSGGVPVARPNGAKRVRPKITGAPFEPAPARWPRTGP